MQNTDNVIDNSAGNRLRLNKALSLAGICSRRKADELISQGRVKVNGETVFELGVRIDPARDVVEVDGGKAGIRLKKDEHIYLALHKPVEVVTTLKDPEGRKTVLDILPPELRNKRPFPVGRLDFYSEGLLIMTTDGDFANILAHPSTHADKVYEVTVRGLVSESMLQSMRSGFRLAEGELLAPMRVEIVRNVSRNVIVLKFILKQGINRLIRRVCRDLGLVILKLKRTSQGCVHLGRLKPGEFRLLTEDEICRLKAKSE